MKAGGNVIPRSAASAIFSGPLVVQWNATDGNFWLMHPAPARKSRMAARRHAAG